MFSTIQRKGRSWNIHLRQNQPKQRPDLHQRLYHPGHWRLWQWNKERVQPLWFAKKNVDKNQKKCSPSTSTDFQRKSTTEIHRYPERRSKNESYEYYERPMSWKTCLRYGQTVKRCHETITTCARCSNEWHNKDKCTSTTVRCCHCGSDHQAFSRNCPIFKREKEIVRI